MRLLWVVVRRLEYREQVEEVSLRWRVLLLASGESAVRSSFSFLVLLRWHLAHKETFGRRSSQFQPYYLVRFDVDRRI